MLKQQYAAFCIALEKPFQSCGLFLLLLLFFTSSSVTAQTLPTEEQNERYKANLERILATQNSGKFSAENDFVKKWQKREHLLGIISYILSLPEDEIDIWKVSLTLAGDAYPDIDMKYFTEEFEAIVARAKDMTPADASPDVRIRTLNTLFYKRMGIDYDKTDYTGKKLPNRYAFGVIDRGVGTCANLAAFYISVAQRLGYPVHAVAAPQHLFARYVDPSFDRQNIDPAGKGGWSSDADYIRDMEIPQKAIDNGVYLRTMTNKELAAELIADHGAYYYGQVRKDYTTATKILERVLPYTPKASEFYNLMGQLLERLSYKDLEPMIQESIQARAYYFRMKSGELGIGKPLTEDYWKHTTKKTKPVEPVTLIPVWEIPLKLKLD